MIEEMRKILCEESEIVFGVSELQVNGLIVRILGSKAEQLFQLVKKLATLVKESSEKNKHLADHAI